jgi:hypothetical protein
LFHFTYFVVGYAQSQLDTDYGAVMVGAQFKGVAATDGSISLNAIIPTAAEGIDPAYCIQLQVLDSAGRTTAQDYTWDGAQWTDTNTGLALEENVNFAPGQGLWVASMVGDAVSLQSSGEVPTSDIEFPLDTDFGAVAVANSFPVELSINDILPTAAEGIDPAYCIQLQVLDNAGQTTAQDYTWDGTQWTDTNTGLALEQDVKFAPGQGLWVASMVGDAVSLILPAPEL